MENLENYDTYMFQEKKAFSLRYLLFPVLFLDVIVVPPCDKYLHSIYKTCPFLLIVRT